MHLSGEITCEQIVTRPIIQNWIQEEYNVTITITSISEMMKKLGYTYSRGNTVGKNWQSGIEYSQKMDDFIIAGSEACQNGLDSLPDDLEF